MIKGTINTGLTIGSYIGNRAILDINTVGLVAGKVSAKQYISSLETIINDVEAIKSMPGAMATGIKNSVVNLATNGLDFFSYETSLAEKTQLVTDFTTVVGTVEAAHGLYKLSKPHLSSLRQRISSSNWYRTLASERGSISLGPKISKAEQIKLNKAQGNAYEQIVKQEISNTQTNVVEQITVKTESGVKTRLDLVGQNKQSGVIELTEVKSSPTAPLTSNQKIAFPEITKTGATVVGKGKPPYTGGIKIPPTKVKINRLK